MPDSGRPKVGPADPETQRKALADYEASATQEHRDQRAAKAKAAPKQPTPAKARSILDELRDALNEKHPREATHNGQTVMDAVDEAVGYAKTVKPDY